MLEQYRLHGLKLLTSLLAQEGYHFTDLSPSGNVIALNERLGFEFLDTTTALVPNLPWPSVARSLPGHRRPRGDPGAPQRARRADLTATTSTPSRRATCVLIRGDRAVLRGLP